MDICPSSYHNFLITIRINKYDRVRRAINV